MRKTTELRRALKQKFFPVVEGKGYIIDTSASPTFITFRKVEADKICAFDIQWDKHGESKFALNFGKSTIDNLIPSDGTVEPENALVHNLKLRGRLKSNFASQWFRLNPNFLGRLCFKSNATPDGVVQNLLNLFPEVEAFFHDNSRGKHLSMYDLSL